MRQLQDEMDAWEFAEWRAAYRVQPWGDDWAQTQLLADMMWQSTKTPEPQWAVPRHFGIGITPDASVPKQQTPEEIAHHLNVWLKGSGLANG